VEHKAEMIALTEELLRKINDARDIDDLRIPVGDFIAAVDKEGVIGDDDLLKWAADASIDRRKDESTAVALFRRHFQH